MLLPKHPRVELPRHLERIRGLHCIVCWSPPPNEAAHLRLGLAGGMALRPSDYYAVPLCHKCHSEQHNGEGEVAFWRDALATNKVLLTAVLRAFARSLVEDEMVAR